MSKAKGRPDVDALLAERARFEAWLEQLAAKASSMPTHVVARVRGDYELRLGKVVEELQARADALRADATALEERVAILDAELTAKRDARAEDELRALVGEYDEDAWRAKSAEHDDGINSVESERNEREAERTRALEMFAEATRPAVVIAAEAPSAAPGPVVEPSAARQTPAAEPAPSIPTSARPSPFDEIGFLRTVVGRTTPFPSVSPTGPEREPPREPPAPPPAPEPRAPEPRVSARVSIPNFDPPAMPDEAPPPLRGSGARPVVAEVAPAPEPAKRNSGSSEAARSLKCQECGSMNYPTEWYCEKCGGELAAF